LSNQQLVMQSSSGQERHVRFITKKLVDNLLSNGQALGKACMGENHSKAVTPSDPATSRFNVHPSLNESNIGCAM